MGGTAGPRARDPLRTVPRRANGGRWHGPACDRDDPRTGPAQRRAAKYRAADLTRRQVCAATLPADGPGRAERHRVTCRHYGTGWRFGLRFERVRRRGEPAAATSPPAGGRAVRSSGARFSVLRHRAELRAGPATAREEAGGLPRREDPCGYSAFVGPSGRAVPVSSRCSPGQTHTYRCGTPITHRPEKRHSKNRGGTGQENQNGRRGGHGITHVGDSLRLPGAEIFSTHPRFASYPCPACPRGPRLSRRPPRAGSGPDRARRAHVPVNGQIVVPAGGRTSCGAEREELVGLARVQLNPLAAGHPAPPRRRSCAPIRRAGGPAPTRARTSSPRNAIGSPRWSVPAPLPRQRSVAQRTRRGCTAPPRRAPPEPP